MNKYIVSYDGNSTRFKDRTFEAYAESKREAVEQLYNERLDYNYFPQEDGTIEDSQGNIIAEPDATTIEYDGGYFSAELQID